MLSIGKKSTWFQILFWGVVWLVIPLILVNADNFDRAFYRGVSTFIVISIVVFVNLEILLPKLYFQKRVAFYILACIGLVLGLYLLSVWDLMPWADYFDPPQKRRSRHRSTPTYWVFFKFISHISPYVISLIGSSLFAIASFASSKEKEMAQLKSEKLEAEMKFLKSQINPHFLFNALNNVYTLSVIKSEATSENILKISGMLRYMLYDCKEDRVPLKKELEYIHNFVELNQLKDSQGLNIELDLDESRPELMVAPLIFIPFIENAFKHSKIEDLEKGWIKISLSTKEDALFFTVKNSVPGTVYTKDKVGGIGLKNVKRQLELVYPDKHELKIDQSDSVFEIFLNIDLG